jgi:hypothetical protein
MHGSMCGLSPWVRACPGASRLPPSFSSSTELIQAAIPISRDLCSSSPDERSAHEQSTENIAPTRLCLFVASRVATVSDEA